MAFFIKHLNEKFWENLLEMIKFERYSAKNLAK